MENDEIRVAKIADVLLSKIRGSIDKLIQLDNFTINNIDNSTLNSAVETNEEIKLKTLSSLIKDIHQFQPCPQLLDKPLPVFISKLSNHYLFIIKNDAITNLSKTTKSNKNNPQFNYDWISEIIYNFTKIRGIKSISISFSSDIYIIDLLLNKIEFLSFSSPSSSNSNWHELSFLLLWLSVLILAPFPLSSINPQIPKRIFKISNYYLTEKSIGKENEVSILLFSKFLSRNDVSSFNYLTSYYLNYLFKFDPLKNSFTNRFLNMNDNEKLSNLKLLSNLLKFIKKDTISPFLPLHYSLINNHFITQFSAQSSLSENSIISKFIIKNLGKLGTSLLSIDPDQLQPPTASIDSNNQPSFNHLIHLFKNFDPFEKIEQIISNLLMQIGHKDTIIRYCVSRQISKIANLLPTDFQLDIINNLISELDIQSFNFNPNLYSPSSPSSSSPPPSLNLIHFNSDQINFDLISSDRYHGILLTLSELTNKRLIPINYFYLLTSILHKSLFFKQQHITFISGSNVRDSSLYLAWSFIRSYTSLRDKIPVQILLQLFNDLIITVSFDKDIMIRRASSAVIQELLGRYGKILWNVIVKNSDYYDDFQNYSPKNLSELSLKLIEILDYTKLGNLKLSYLEISFDIFTKLNLFQKSFLSYLINYNLNTSNTSEIIQNYQSNEGINSYDPEVRKLSAIILKKLLQYKQNQYKSIKNKSINLLYNFQIPQKDGIDNDIQMQESNEIQSNNNDSINKELINKESNTIESSNDKTSETEQTEEKKESEETKQTNETNETKDKSNVELTENDKTAESQKIDKILNNAEIKSEVGINDHSINDKKSSETEKDELQKGAVQIISEDKSNEILSENLNENLITETPLENDIEDFNSVVLILIGVLIRRCKLKNIEGNFYALAEILPLVFPEIPYNLDEFYLNNTLKDLLHKTNILQSDIVTLLNSIVEILHEQKFDYHKDPPHKGEEFIYLLGTILPYVNYLFIYNNPRQFDGSTKLKNNDPLGLDFYNSVFNIIRQTSNDISEKFKFFIEKLSLINLKSKTFTDSIFIKKWLYYIKNGNLISSENFGYLNLDFIFPYLESKILPILTDKRVDYQIRKNIMTSISIILSRPVEPKNERFKLSGDFMIELINQLDDYTLTNQGDVGNKVRFEVTQLIFNNRKSFLESVKYIQLIEKKLIRISGEVIDRLKFKAFELLLIIKNETKDLKKFSSDYNYIEYSDEKYKQKHGKSYLDLVPENWSFDTMFDYYKFLLNFYYDNYLIDMWEFILKKNRSKEENEKLSFLKDVSKEFWKGFVFSAGAIQASDTTIIHSLNSLIWFLNKKLSSDKFIIIELMKHYNYHYEVENESINKIILKNEELKTLVFTDILTILKNDPMVSKNASTFNSRIRVSRGGRDVSNRNMVNKSLVNNRVVKNQLCCLNLFSKLFDANIKLPNADQSIESKEIKSVDAELVKPVMKTPTLKRKVSANFMPPIKNTISPLDIKKRNSPSPPSSQISRSPSSLKKPVPKTTNESSVTIQSHSNLVKALYIRTYNLHLNTANFVKISLCLKIFQYLILVEDFKESLKRLCWLCCNHQLKKIKLLSCEYLYQIYFDKLSKLVDDSDNNIDEDGIEMDDDDMEKGNEEVIQNLKISTNEKNGNSIVEEKDDKLMIQRIINSKDNFEINEKVERSIDGQVKKNSSDDKVKSKNDNKDSVKSNLEKALKILSDIDWNGEDDDRLKAYSNSLYVEW
ncbi:uncharacterized protein ASCRUDRAFT_102979 [Ascoidea rubescens DSM 1968]|uniref:Tubulin-folding cofactor D ARM repeats domain-containing protein n=1 Tax=Ascoidea rubescens DSM 1968 TaxID=1344418 RepID=A0A1D2VRD0_9ASCO|nr:hypothetical protein ASCRUDRAFT_102979 [Ascoidea rubescens DSM 1968]ODV64149.1 hypothetical protein ASCRUDRAFT_102979 [Ascoidea rubescens DSM 1968]